MKRGLPALGLLLLCACGQPRKEAPAPAVPPPLCLVVAGDILMHEDVKQSAAAHGMDSLFAEVAPLFQEADLGFANLETAIAPRTGGPGAPYQFNAPAELAPALRKAGITVLSTANNHAFDQGSRAVAETLDHLEASDLRGAGSGRSRGAAEAPLLMDLRGHRVALFAFTDLFNGNLNRKPDQPWVAGYDEVRSPERVKAARAGSDVVVVSLHWGDEYALQPNARQRSIAQALVAAGADLILGHHPHVLQPVERIQAGGREGLVAFSLGNLVSNQDRMYRHGRHKPAAGDNRDGVALRVTFPRGERSTVRALPLWTENNWLERQGKVLAPAIRVIPVERALEAERRRLETLSDPKLQEASRDRIGLLETRRDRIHAILGL